MKIVSLLPSATEILHFIGAFDEVVAVSDECDYPPEAAAKPRAMRRLVKLDGLASSQINDAVARQLREKGTLYAVEEELLMRLQPDIVLIQDMCDVCSITPSQSKEALDKLRSSFGTRVISLNPHNLFDIFRNILEVGAETGHSSQAGELVSGLLRRTTDICECALTRRSAEVPDVLMLEWIDPPYSSGHWVPDMVTVAGGRPLLAKSGEYSRKLSWDEIRDSNPDIVVIAPCGFKPERTFKEIDIIRERLMGLDVPAAVNCRVYVTDEYCLAKPGPRIVDGIEALHSLLCDRHDFRTSRPGLWRVGSHGGVEALK